MNYVICFLYSAILNTYLIFYFVSRYFRDKAAKVVGGGRVPGNAVAFFFLLRQPFPKYWDDAKYFKILRFDIQLSDLYIILILNLTIHFYYFMRSFWSWILSLFLWKKCCRMKSTPFISKIIPKEMAPILSYLWSS